MITFKEYYEDGDHLKDRDTIAILPGGFKPPTLGHFLALKDLLEEADRGMIQAKDLSLNSNQKLYGTFIRNILINL
jgi:phosphopantetheine adenylyltransferase